MGYVTECFAKRLKEIREAAGLTQVQLASELGVSRGAISYYEKGERTPDIEFLDKLSGYFGVSLNFLMSYTSNIKDEHNGMYDTYGLTDVACDKLSIHHKLGNLISAVLGHQDFNALRSLYEQLILNHDLFDASQLGYVGFLMSDSLNKIIFDSLVYLRNMQLSPEEITALNLERTESINAINKMISDFDEKHRLFQERANEEEKRFEEDFRKEHALQLKAQENVREKFWNTIEGVEFYRERRHS